MDKEKVTTLIKRIVSDLEELAKVANTGHISAFIIDGHISLADYTEIRSPKFHYHKSIYGEEIKIYE